MTHNPEQLEASVNDIRQCTECNVAVDRGKSKQRTAPRVGEPLRLAMTCRVLQHWRVPVYRRLADSPGITFRAFYGTDFPGTKTVSGRDLSGFAHRRLATIKVRLPYMGETIGLPVCPSLIWHLWRFRPHVILAEGGSNLANNVFVFLFALLTHTPVVWWTLGELRSIEQPSMPLRLWRAVLRTLERSSTAWLGYSSLALRYFERRNYPPSACFRAVNCVDTDRILGGLDAAAVNATTLRKSLSLGPGPVLLFVGALNPSKRLEDLIDVYGRLKSKFPTLRLLIVGDGPHRVALECFARQHGLNDVLFVGEVVADVSNYFLLADLFVLPGLGGLSISEAMAHGLPVIATRADGCETDLVEPGKNGFLLSEGDRDQLHSTLNELLSDPAMLKQMGNHSRWIIEHKFNIRTYMDNVIAAIRYAAARC